MEDDPMFLLAIAMSGDNPIEWQEKEGQRQLTASPRDNVVQLPRKGNGCEASEIYKNLGFEVIGNHDDLFYDVKIKEGWDIQRTNHSMWNHLVDPKGNIRASIFYKAAFYDRDSFINPLFNRYYITTDYQENRKQDDFRQHVRVKDRRNNLVLFEREGVVDIYEVQREVYEKECRKYLDNNYPSWESPMMYWD